MTNNNLTYYVLFGMLLLLTATATTVLNPVLAQGQNMTGGNATAGNMTDVKFMFIQGAQSGSISEVNTTTSILELSDVSDKTIMFSDRPDRIVGSVNTTDFIGNWSMGPDSFAADPPNAVLVLDDEKQRQDAAVIELHNPEYDPEGNTLKFYITARNATATTTTTASIDLPGEFGQSTLLIDEKKAGGEEIDIADMFEMQMAMNKLSQSGK
jgi:hypothetical protein